LRTSGAIIHPSQISDDSLKQVVVIPGGGSRISFKDVAANARNLSQTVR